VNKRRPIASLEEKKDYYKEHKEDIKEYNKEYHKEHQKINKDKIEERRGKQIECPVCNKSMRKDSLLKHTKRFH
jgi:DNA repair exonuclease SbcCD ATPase subunit